MVGYKITAAIHRMDNYPIYVFGVLPATDAVTEWWARTWPTYLLLFLLFSGTIGTIYWVGRKNDAWMEERKARISELENASNLLRQANSQLETRNSEMESFMYSVSHDLRSPIRAIDGYAAILGDEIRSQNQTEALTLLDAIRTNAKRMSVLLADLLELARTSAQDLQVQPIDMQSKVASVIGELNLGIPAESIQIDKLPPHKGDPILMRQVWANLISNAAKYSAKNAHPRIRIGFENGEYFVEDNGIGFDMAHKDKLFKLFSRLHGDADYGGTGVGLAIVKRIVEKHAGHVRAQSDPDTGTRFSFSVGSPYSD